VSNAQHDALVDSVSPTAAASPRRPQEQPGILDPYKTRFMTANSGVAFPRLLGIELSSSDAPRLHSFAWNLGVRPEPHFETAEVVNYLSFEQFQPLAEVYFSVIHPIYNFIDQGSFTERCQRRFSSNSKDHRFDPVICGVAALGSLFSSANRSLSNEHALVELAKNILEQTSTLSSPTYDQVAAWILRTIYLRATTRPHASWLSSCTTMHLIEATGLHQEISQIAIVTPPAPESTESEAELRRRLFWTAKSVNKIISHEYGRSCVKLSSINIKPLSSPDETFLLKNQYIALVEILPGDEVNPCDTEGLQALHDAVSVLAGFDSSSDEITLFKADLAFGIYRRMRMKQTSGHSIPADTIALIIDLGLEALPSSSALAARKLPWWTVISVPFQLVCILLAIDSRNSLSHVARAMAALEEVGKYWDTHMIREAIGSAGLLVKLSRKRKEEDMKWLDDGMPKSGGLSSLPATAGGDRMVETGSLEGHQPGIANCTVLDASSQIPGVAMPNSLDFIDGLDIPLPDNLSIDWNNFFFHNFDRL
jgi:Fungal specific transcription factor domain